MSKLKHQPYTAFKLWLAGHGYVYKNVAECIDCSEATVQMKINGSSDFLLTEVKDICRHLGCDPAIFFEREIA